MASKKVISKGSLFLWYKREEVTLMVFNQENNLLTLNHILALALSSFKFVGYYFSGQLSAEKA